MRISEMLSLICVLTLLASCGDAGSEFASDLHATSVLDSGTNAAAEQSVSKQPLARRAAELPAKGVASTDIIYRASASDLTSYRYAGLQCAGGNQYWWIWGGSAGRYAPSAPDPLLVEQAVGGTATSFATVDSPGEPGKKAFYFALRNTDTFTPSWLTNSKRCEMNLGWEEYSYPSRTVTRTVGLPRNLDFWWGTSIRLADWHGTNDRQIVWQWHDGGGTGSLQPLLSLWVQGDQLRVMVAHDSSANPSDATLTKVWPWTITGWTPNSWIRFVVQARIDTATPGNSYARIWMNGQQVVNYAGPIGYPSIAAPDFAKIGIYHWTDSDNNWDNTVTDRRAWFKSPLLVIDRSGYSESLIAALMD